MKKFVVFNLILIISVLCCVGLHISFFSEVYAVSTGEANFTNLIVFAKFDGEQEFINDICGDDTTVKQLIENSYSLADYSVKDYYYRVSNGKVNMQNVYLFDNSNSLTLSHERGYFYEKNDNNEMGYDTSEYELRLNELKQDWANAILTALNNGNSITNLDCTKNHSIGDLDKNGDGKIDSITIIYKYSTDFDGSWKGCLWNYQSYSNMVELSNNGSTIASNAYVQITYDYNSFYTSGDSTIKFANLKTMIHEMGHIFGLKDLYNTSSNSPVWYMSAMAKAISHVPQYISAKEREVLGWITSSNISTITEAKEYTIGVTSSDISSGIICYKCDVPSLDKTLYLEYRKFDGDINKYDSMDRILYDKNGELIKNISIKSGLVCFLLDKDTLYPNNMYCNQYNWNYQVLGGQYSTKTDSALTSGDSLNITDNLSIQVLSLDNQQLAFKVEGTDFASSHNHTLEKVEYSAPTCTEAGNIEYFKCSTCNKYFLADGTEIRYSDTIISPAHTIKLIAEKPSTCTEYGNIEYCQCTVCKKYFLPNGTEIDYANTIVGLKDHTPEKIEGTPASCTHTGLTDGQKCSVCKKILVEQEIISLADHTPSDWIVDIPATSSHTGSKHKECTICEKLLETEIIPIEETDTPTPPQQEHTPAESTGKSSNSKFGIIKIVCILVGVPTMIVIPSVIIGIKRRKRR